MNNDLEKRVYLFNKGEYFDSYLTYGAHPVENKENTFRFTVWAPAARAVSVVGDFTDWSEEVSLTKVGETGTWTGIVSEVFEGQSYKYRVVQADGTIKYKIDPFGFEFEVRPKDATIIKRLPQREWQDQEWMEKREKNSIYRQPVNIYEVHLSSWKHHDNGDWYSISELEEELIPYAKEMGYTHIQFMPLMEHPLDASWGYQITGYYGFSSKYGKMEDFQQFVETCHLNGIGVLVDWVPGHFNRNDYALAYFDGTPQFEYTDKNQADNRGWGALNFDLGKSEVQSFLISNAIFWMEMFHLDGLRVDAVSNMLYLDYDVGPWTPNEEGTNINYQGIAFLQKLNEVVFDRFAGIMMAAEESTSFDGVTRPVYSGGLGFNYKWNMGWMNDTLEFFEMDPEYRKHAFNLITFSFMYTFSENFILPFSHDEVVHGKKSLMHKMYGDRYNQFASLRTMEAYRMTFPGKKLEFMGSEFGQFLEWRFHEGLSWYNLEDEKNQKHQYYMQTLNKLYRTYPALWENDHHPDGLHIQKADDPEETVLIYRRQGLKQGDFLIIVLNFRPHEYSSYDIEVPYAGRYEIILNTERKEFGGNWISEETMKKSRRNSDGSFSIHVTLPAMGALIIAPVVQILNDHELEAEIEEIKDDRDETQLSNLVNDSRSF